VELEYEACNVVQLRVVAVERGVDALIVRLGKKHTDCLAKELCVPAAATAAAGACKPGSGCC
jgi:hypothetical protein